MPVINTFDGLIDLEKQAIEFLRNFDPIQYTGKPYYVAYSGGKDSDVIRILAQLAGVPHELWHNHTTVDAPETVRYIRSIPGINIDYPHDNDGNPVSMWSLMRKNGLPTRTRRWCCVALKEGGGRDRFVVTGVRWAESVKRKNSRSLIETYAKKKENRIILHNDNETARRTVERCAAKGKMMFNPIIHWRDEQVWEFLHHYGCESNPLYQCGYRRVGCVGCPMSRRQEKEFERYPEYKKLYKRAIGNFLDYRAERGVIAEDGLRTVDDWYRWWVSGKALPRQIEGQLDFDDMEEV